MSHVIRNRLILMPLTLLSFPLMLVLLCFSSVWVSILSVGGLLSACFVVYLVYGSRRDSWLTYSFSSIQLAIFALMVYATGGMNFGVLTYQVLWMLAFLLIHLISIVLIRHNRFPRLSEASCCCDRRRQETLRAEYIRFDRVILRLCLFSIALYLPFIYLVAPSPALVVALELTLSAVTTIAIIVEIYNLVWLNQYLSREVWVPVLSAGGETIGRVAQSAIENYTEGYLPVVRLIAVSQGMIYLEDTASCISGKQKRYDTPFTDWLVEGDQAQSVAQRMIDARFCGIRRAIPRQLLPYSIEENNRKYLVYLMVVQIEDPSQLYIDCRPIEGKWWSLDLLRESFGQVRISPNIESELPLIEQTILLAERLSRQVSTE